MKNQHIPFELVNDLRAWIKNNFSSSNRDEEIAELKKVSDTVKRLEDMSIEIPGDLLRKRKDLEAAINILNDDEMVLQKLAEELASLSNEIKRNLLKSGTKPKSPPKKLRVTLPDGRFICEKKAVDTFLKTLQFMGLNNCAKINTVIQLGHPVVSTTPNEYKDKQSGNIKEFDGYFIETKTSTDKKAEQLREYARELNINIRVESIG